MKPISSRPRGAAIYLLGTASFLTIASATAAQAADGAAPPPVEEEILVTGSLIRGAPAVGVPVTAITDEDFREAGAVTISDVLRTLPSVEVAVNLTVTASGAVSQRPQEVAIRGLSTGAGTETLMMINGMRFPIQGFSAEYVDPSIISPFGVERIDVLAEGASATYGTDAVAGVINIILKRGYDGAMSSIRYGRSWDIGIPAWTFNQLYGRVWDGGQVTLSYQWKNEDNAHGRVRDYFTLNFEPYGFDDRRPFGSSAPATISPGASQTVAGMAALGFDRRIGARACSNCFSVPAGTGWNYGDTLAHTNPLVPTPTTTWTTILANPGVKNLHDPAEVADVVPAMHDNRATLTFDQIIADDLFGVFRNVNLFADAFYSNHRTTGHYTPGASPSSEQSVREISVPTNNPYRPTGAPANILVSYNLSYETPSRLNTAEVATRYAFGFEADLPYDWRGRVFYSKSEDKNYVHVTGMVNTNHLRAALGQTVTGTLPGQGPYSKPANIPYFNIFCDATVYQCNSPITLNYINAFRFYDQHFDIGETGINLDGPVFDLPGGQVKAAIGADFRSDHYIRVDTVNFNTYATNVFDNPREGASSNTWAVFAQVNIPLVGEANRLPLVEAFNIEAAYRFDHYAEQGYIKTPKIAATWQVGGGLTVRGAWGKAFRAPSVAEASTYSVQLQSENIAAGEPSDVFALDCAAAPGQPNNPNVANPGSLTALLNPTCAPGSRFQGGIDLAGGAGGASPVRTGPAVGPENAKNWSVGFNFAPTNFLAGLNIDTTYYNLRINDLLTGKTPVGPNDPRNVICTAAGPNCNYIVRSNPLLPITDPANAEFLALVTELTSNPRANIKNTSAIQYIRDGSITNVGWREIHGVDFDARYDFEAGEWGNWNVGIRGDYRLYDKNLPSNTAGAEVIDSFEGDTGGRLKYRGRLGWTGADGFSVTGFVNYTPHSAPATTLPQPCYWAAGFGPGSCYAGSPYFGPYDQYPLYSPAMYTVDLTVAYDTADKFANEYLNNLNLSFTVANLFNSSGPFTYQFASGRGIAADPNAGNGYLQRYISFTITKVW